MNKSISQCWQFHNKYLYSATDTDYVLVTVVTAPPPWKWCRISSRFLNRIKALVICVALTTIFNFYLNVRHLQNKSNHYKWAVCLLDLWAVTVTVDLRRHGFRTARVLGHVLLFLLRTDHQHHHNDEENREEQPDNDADDQHKSVVTAVSLVELAGDYPCGKNFPFLACPLLGAAVERDVKDVGAAVVVPTNLFYYVWHIRGRSFGAMLALWKQTCVLAHYVIFQASFPYAAVSVVSRTDGVDGVNVPLSSCRNLEGTTVVSWKRSYLLVFFQA